MSAFQCTMCGCDYPRNKNYSCPLCNPDGDEPEDEDYAEDEIDSPEE